MNQVNGIQLTSRPGTDFATQYNVPDTGLTNNSTLSAYSAVYNMLRADFNGKQSERVPDHSKNNLFLANGLKQNVTEGSHKLFTQA